MEDNRVIITYCGDPTMTRERLFGLTCGEIKANGDCPDENCMGRIE